MSTSADILGLHPACLSDRDIGEKKTGPGQKFGEWRWWCWAAGVHSGNTISLHFSEETPDFPARTRLHGEHWFNHFLLEFSREIELIFCWEIGRCH